VTIYPHEARRNRHGNSFFGGFEKLTLMARWVVVGGRCADLLPALNFRQANGRWKKTKTKKQKTAAAGTFRLLFFSVPFSPCWLSSLLLVFCFRRDVYFFILLPCGFIAKQLGSAVSITLLLFWRPLLMQRNQNEK